MGNTTTFSKHNQPANRGRKKGSLNRTTEEIRTFIQQIVDKNLANLETDLSNMNPTNRWIILDKITKYFLPALTKNDNNNMNSGEVKITVEYQDSTPAIEHKDQEKEKGD